MHDENLKEKIQQLYDGELTEADAKVLKGHFQECGECRQAFERLSVIKRGFSSQPFPKASEAFVKRVMSRVEAVDKEVESVTKPNWFKVPDWLMPVLGYGFAAIVLLIAVTQRTPLITTETVLLQYLPEETQWAVVPEMPSAVSTFEN